MSRLWKVSLAFGLAGAVSMVDALRFAHSMWPVVVLLCAGAVVACIASTSDYSEAREKKEQAEDSAEAMEALRKQLSEDLAKVVTVVNSHAADIDYLKKRGVYGDTLGG